MLKEYIYIDDNYYYYYRLLRRSSSINTVKIHTKQYTVMQMNKLYQADHRSQIHRSPEQLHHQLIFIPYTTGNSTRSYFGHFALILEHIANILNEIAAWLRQL